MVNAHSINTSPGAPPLPTLATTQPTSILLLPVANVTRPLNSKSQISSSGRFKAILSTAAVTVVTLSPVCL